MDAVLWSETGANLSTNTVAKLIAGIETLGRVLGVELGPLSLSWGHTLDLAYAQLHPQQVKALVLGFVTTTLFREVG